MKQKYNFVGEAIYNQFTIPESTRSDTLEELSNKGFLLYFYIRRTREKDKGAFVATFNHLYAN